MLDMQEYEIVAREFSLSLSRVAALASGVVDHIFEGDEVKKELRQRSVRHQQLPCKAAWLGLTG
jgi:hypothetical protein